jgi:hypothetical protein
MLDYCCLQTRKRSIEERQAIGKYILDVKRDKGIDACAAMRYLRASVRGG